MNSETHETAHQDEEQNCSQTPWTTTQKQGSIRTIETLTFRKQIRLTNYNRDSKRTPRFLRHKVTTETHEMTPRSETKLRPNSIIYKSEAGEHKNHRDTNFSQANSSGVLQRGHEANTEVLDAQGIDQHRNPRTTTKNTRQTGEGVGGGGVGGELNLGSGLATARTRRIWRGRSLPGEISRQRIAKEAASFWTVSEVARLIRLL